MTEPRNNKRLSLDEILDLASEVARDESAGPDRFRAMKMLASASSAAVLLPVPLTDAEVIADLTIIMRSAGAELCQISYRKAFPRTRRGSDISPRLMLGDIPEHIRERASRTITLKMLYRDFPVVKRSGFPTGYPQKGTLLEQQEWCQRCAADLIIAEEQEKLDETPGIDAKAP